MRKQHLLQRVLVRLGIWSAPQGLSVESSVIKAISYDRRHQALLITFNSGVTYKYGCVEPRVARELVKADSKGKFFNGHLRNNHDYPYRLVESKRKEEVALAA